MTSRSTGANIALLADRGVVRVAGEDAEKLLQGVITTDMELLSAQPAIHAALLTPQGKYLQLAEAVDFFQALRGDNGFHGKLVVFRPSVVPSLQHVSRFSKEQRLTDRRRVIHRLTRPLDQVERRAWPGRKRP